MKQVLVIRDDYERIIGVAADKKAMLKLLVNKKYIGPNTPFEPNPNNYDWITLYEKFGKTWETELYNQDENAIECMLDDYIFYSYFTIQE